MKKILFVASTLSHIENFHIPYLKYFKEKGFEVHILGTPNNKSQIEYADKIYPITFEKNMFSINNFKNVFKISKIIKLENYDIISLHTTLASFFARLGMLISLHKSKLVINTVHGYLFDDNTSFIKRLIFILCEKIVKPVTNTIIVMNSADYCIAEKYKLYKDDLYIINGMGVNTSKFPATNSENKCTLREKFNFSKNDFILVYIAEFSKRKNQKFLIKSLAALINEGFSDIKLLLIGDGKLFDEVVSYSKELNVYNNIIFTGYTKNTCSYYQLSDLCVSSSRIEGLPFNVIEAMSTGLPVVASDIKGHNDLVKNNYNGFLYEYDNINQFCSLIKLLSSDRKLLHDMSQNSLTVSKKYSLDSVFNNNIEILISEYNKSLTRK
ncbi:MAG TPA: glycosyltransferase family 1 protein [Clostridium sp.]|nr:glycosyltransferase family 1 protein [Clostridium sp.]